MISATSGQPEYKVCFSKIGVAQFSVFCVVFCQPLLVLLSFLSSVLSVVQRLIASDCFEFISKFGL